MPGLLAFPALVVAVQDAPLFEAQTAGLEGVGFDDVAAHGQKTAVQRSWSIGPRDTQRVHAPLVAFAAEVLGRQLERLQGGAHRAVEHEHAAAQGLQVISRSGLQHCRDRNADTSSAQRRSLGREREC